MRVCRGSLAVLLTVYLVAGWASESEAQAPPPPQLVIDSVVWPPVMAPGVSYDVPVTITNVGTLPTGPLEAWRVFLTPGYHEVTLAVGTSTTISFQLFFNDGYCNTRGDGDAPYCYVDTFVTLDAQNWDWLSYATLDSEFRVLGVWENWPEISGAIVSAPATVVAGQPFLVHATLTNAGYSAWVSPFANAVRYVDATNPQTVWAQFPAPGPPSVPWIGRGETRTITSTITLVTPGTFTLGLELGEVGTYCYSFVDLYCPNNANYAGPVVTVLSGADAGVVLDAGNIQDAGVVLDAAPLPDATVLPDAAPVLDAGVVLDAAPLPDADDVQDAGVVLDAAPALDAGVVVDATPLPDAGDEQDAGVVLDAAPVLDAGVVLDAAPLPDASVVPEAGVVLDATPLPDADVVLDASPASDIVVIVDGAEPDATAVPDAAAFADAQAVLDGAAAEAGAVDDDAAATDLGRVADASTALDASTAGDAMVARADASRADADSSSVDGGCRCVAPASNDTRGLAPLVLAAGLVLSRSRRRREAAK